ncbi:MAG: hypothetical protein U0J62_09640 [Lachnospiraceae bacterium]|nr:hypothetical protein [Lachnospiraceae bacterium]
MNNKNTSNEKEPKRECTEEEFTEFSKLMYRTAALPREAREKVTIYAQAVIAMSELKGA